MSRSIGMFTWLVVATLFYMSGSSSQVSRLTWSSFSAGCGTSQQLNSRLLTVAGQVFVGSSSGSGNSASSGLLYDSLVRGSLTEVWEPRYQADQIPLMLRLLQNYPNPFNPTTEIRFDVPRSAYVSVRVYNLLGQEVAVLVDGVEHAGAKSVAWDASAVPSGIYICRLVSDGIVSSMKMILLK